eukprot:m.139055 g.139055  ORF g.139055 m.139055 type:complete len:230 (-) comp30029_c2_seq11:184-873(-)
MTKPTAVSVLLFVPNLIGYGRVITMIIAVMYMPSQPWLAMAFYFTSAFLDAFDGLAARALGQSSTVGAMLDMLTDRVGTCILAMYVATQDEYQGYEWFFQLYVGLDIVSHWGHLHSTMMSGRESHKTKAGDAAVKLVEGEIDLNKTILGIYYKKAPLFFFCSANELFFITAYLLPHETDKSSTTYSAVYWTLLVCFPLMVIKSMISAVHLFTAFWNMAAYDAARLNAKK